MAFSFVPVFLAVTLAASFQDAPHAGLRAPQLSASRRPSLRAETSVDAGNTTTGNATTGDTDKKETSAKFQGAHAAQTDPKLERFETSFTVGFAEQSMFDALLHQALTPEQQFGAFGVCALTIAAIVAAIYAPRGILTCVSICSYISSLSLMSVLIRRVYIAYSFGYPQFLTATHFLSTCLVGFGLLFWRRATQGKPIVVPSPATFCWGIVPVAVANALSIGLSNRGLLYCNAHFYEMLASQSLVVTAFVGTAMGRPLNSKLLPPLMCVTLGLLFLAIGELHFSATGAVCIFLGVLFRSAKVQVQGLLLGGGAVVQQLDPVELVVWSSTSGFTLMFAWSLAAEGMAPIREITAASTLFGVLVSCFAAVVLNFSAIYVLRELGPVAQQCVGQLKGAAACVVAVAALGEMVSQQQVLGYSVVIASIMWYNRVDQLLKGERLKCPR